MTKLILLAGIQGSGKGTLAKKFIEDKKKEGINISYIEMGNICRNSEVLRAYIDKGNMVPDNIIDDIFIKQLEQELAKKSCCIIIDGYPRNLHQASVIINNIKNKYSEDITLVELDMPYDLVIKRLQARAAIENRKDDNDKSAIEKRIKTYQEETVKAIQWLKMFSEGGSIQYRKVNITDSPVEVNYKKFVNALKAKKTQNQR